jgi:DNA polymerase-3 subunit beta
MQLRITKSSLVAVVQAVQGAVQSRATTLPILSHLSLNADRDQLQLTGTDLDLFITAVAGCTVRKPGAYCVSANKLAQIAKSMPGDADAEITIEESTKKGRLVITSGGSRFELLTIDHAEYPPLPTIVSESPSVDIPQEELKRLFTLTAFAASSDQSRFVLCGVFFEFQKGNLTLVATDGRRVSTASSNVALETDHNFILPTRAAREVARHLGEEGDVSVTITDKFVRFNTGSAVIYSKQIEGNYPNWRQVVPAFTSKPVSIDRLAFIGALRRVQLIAEDGTIKFVDHELTVLSRADLKNKEDGEARETLAVGKSKDMEIAFHLAYIEEPLQSITDESVAFYSTDALSPIMLASGTWRYVAMPQRLEAVAPADTAAK